MTKYLFLMSFYANMQIVNDDSIGLNQKKIPA